MRERLEDKEDEDKKDEDHGSDNRKREQETGHI